MLPLQGSRPMLQTETFAWQEKRKPDDVVYHFSKLMEQKAVYMNTDANPDFSKEDLLVSLQWIYYCKEDLVAMQDEASFEFAKYVMSRTPNEIACLSQRDHAEMECAGLDPRDFERFAKVENLAKFISKLEKN